MTQENLQKFITALAQHGNVTAAALEAGLSRSSAYRHRSQDNEFAQAWDAAIDEATDLLASEALRRALQGVEEIRYFKGEPIGTVRRYSDQLLMFLLRAYRPSVFGNAKKGTPKRDQQSSDHARKELIAKMASLDGKDDAS